MKQIPPKPGARPRGDYQQELPMAKGGYSNQWGNEPWGSLPGGQQVKGISRKPKAAGPEHLDKLKGSGIAHEKAPGPGAAGEPRDEKGRWTK